MNIKYFGDNNGSSSLFNDESANNDNKRTAKSKYRER